MKETDEPRYNTPFKEAIAKGKAAHIKPYFKNNQANQGVIFKEDMTYFKNISDPQKLDAVKNYGMKNFKQVMNDAEEYGFPLPEKQSKQQFEDWWKSKAASDGNFKLKDVKGNDILLNADPKGHKSGFTKEHLINNKHFDYAHLIEDALKQPNEAWSFFDKGKKGNPLTHTYLKYFNGDNDHKVLVTIVKEEKGALRLTTSYFINQGDWKIRERLFTNTRKGLLLHSIKRF